MFTNVIVKTPCKAVTEGITSAPELGKPDYEKASALVIDDFRSGRIGRITLEEPA